MFGIGTSAISSYISLDIQLNALVHWILSQNRAPTDGTKPFAFVKPKTVVYSPITSNKRTY